MQRDYDLHQGEKYMSSREELLDKLANAVVGGKVDLAKEGAQEVLAAGNDVVTALDAINEGLVKGMSIVGDKYAAHQVTFLRY